MRYGLNYKMKDEKRLDIANVVEGTIVPSRAEVLRTVADTILAAPAKRVVRIGIDGVDGAGKTVFGDELAQVLRASGRPIIRASVDSFHHPQSIRYRLGRHSPHGYFRDSYNYVQLKAVLLDPLSSGGSGWYRTAAFDHRTDLPVSQPLAYASPDAILVFDGIFLHRPELRAYWDISVFLQVGFDMSIPRGA
jgi:uridine kinase